MGEKLQHTPFEMSDAVALIAHPAALLLLTPFIVVFLWAAWLELKRWYLHGPSANQRANFPIDETAPSYEPPRHET